MNVVHPRWPLRGSLITALGTQGRGDSVSEKAAGDDSGEGGACRALEVWGNDHEHCAALLSSQSMFPPPTQ